MKEIRIWECDYCGASYRHEEDAQRCEEWHKKGLRIVSEDHHPRKALESGFPRKIVVFADDDTKRTYLLREEE